MQDPGLRYQYAPPYSPQRTDPHYEQNWQRSPEYSPPQDDTLLGPFMQAQDYHQQDGDPDYLRQFAQIILALAGQPQGNGG